MMERLICIRKFQCSEIEGNGSTRQLLRERIKRIEVDWSRGEYAKPHSRLMEFSHPAGRPSRHYVV